MVVKARGSIESEDADEESDSKDEEGRMSILAILEEWRGGCCVKTETTGNVSLLCRGNSEV